MGKLQRTFTSGDAESPSTTPYFQPRPLDADLKSGQAGAVYPDLFTDSSFPELGDPVFHDNFLDGDLWPSQGNDPSHLFGQAVLPSDEWPVAGMDDPFAAFLDGSLAPDASVVTEPSLPFNGHFSAQGSCVDPAALYAQLAPSQMDGILHFGHVDAVEDDAVFDANLSAYDAEDSEDDTCDVDHVVPKVEPTPEQLPRAESDNKKGGSVEVPETVPDAEPDMSDDGDDGDGEYHPHSGRAPTRVLRPRAAARRKASNPYPSPAPSRGEDDSEHGIQCQKCVRRFKRPAELVRHASLHLPVAEQTVVCGICDKAFKGKRKDALRRHQMSTRACLDLQEQYSDKELEAMGCVTRAGRANSRSRT